MDVQMASDRTKSELGALALLLDSFARQRGYIPERAVPVDLAADLPERLRRLAGAIKPPACWRAWSDGPRFWFMIGRVRQRAADARSAGLELLFISQDGEPVAAGLWAVGPGGDWALTQVLEPEFPFPSGYRWCAHQRIPMRELCHRARV